MAKQIKFVELALRAHAIFKTLGARRAAGYLRNKEVSLEDALVLLGAASAQVGLNTAP